ncbi:MAG: hypothetical protein QOI07_3993 [Verrucomicrobiota bacterium]
MSEEETIPVLVEHDSGGDTKRAFGRPDKSSFDVAHVSPDVLSRNIDAFLSKFEPILKSQDKNYGEFCLDEMELSLSISGEGGVSLIGMVKAGAAASIKIKLKRTKSS